jgi:hypothetical protein
MKKIKVLKQVRKNIGSLIKFIITKIVKFEADHAELNTKGEAISFIIGRHNYWNKKLGVK